MVRVTFITLAKKIVSTNSIGDIMVQTKKKFNFPLGHFPGEKHPCATEPINSDKFFPARTDIYDREGKKLYSAGDPIVTMFTMNWKDYGAYPPNLDKWEIDYPEVVNNSMKPSADEIETQTNLRDDLYHQADSTDSISEREEIMKKARSQGQRLWAMKAKRAGYYDKTVGEQVSSEEDLKHAESKPVSELRDQ